MNCYWYHVNKTSFTCSMVGLLATKPATLSRSLGEQDVWSHSRTKQETCQSVDELYGANDHMFQMWKRLHTTHRPIWSQRPSVPNVEKASHYTSSYMEPTTFCSKCGKGFTLHIVLYGANDHLFQMWKRLHTTHRPIWSQRPSVPNVEKA